MMDSNLSIMEKFWNKVQKTNTCWFWIGSKNWGGYGQLASKGKKIRAHRISWELHFGPIQKGMCICHKCDNPSCVNPSHLFLGTISENNKDMHKKGHANGGSMKGEHNPSCILSEKKVKRIRKLYKTGKFSQMKLGKHFNISQQTVSSIVLKTNWKHV